MIDEHDFPDVRQCIGRAKAQRTLPIERLLEQFGLNADSGLVYGIVIRRSRLIDFLRIELSLDPRAPAPAQSSTEGFAIKKLMRRRSSEQERPKPELAVAGLSDSSQAWRNLLVEYGAFPEGFSNAQVEDYFKQFHLLSGKVTSQDVLRLAISLNTDDHLLLNAFHNRDPGSVDRTPCGLVEIAKGNEGDDIDKDDRISSAFRAWLEVTVYSPLPAGENTVRPQPLRDYIRLNFSEFSPLANFKGFAALDLGNTSTSFACMAETERKKIHVLDLRSELQTVDKPGPGSSDPLLSAVHLTDYREPANPDDVPFAVWEVGQDAFVTPDDRGLILSPKRLAAAPPELEGTSLTLHGVPTEVPNPLPAELMIASVFKRVYHRLRENPAPITLTYPSTFSILELNRLVQAAACGINRAQEYEKQVFDDEWVRWVDDQISLKLDEATAATFYFLYRDFFYKNGRLSAFHYLYNHGANILVLDCGGGTTDVALVHAKTTLNRVGGGDEKGRDKYGKHWKVRLELLGRTGLRQFGGDQITVAVYKVLKALLAVRVTRDRTMTIPQDPAQFGRWYEENAKIIDKEIPTAFAHLDPRVNEDEYIRARTATKQFWNLSTQVKERISAYVDAGSDNPALESFCARFPEPSDQLTAYLMQRLTGQEGAQAAPVASEGEFLAKFWKSEFAASVAKHIPFVDAQIRKALEECLTKTNRLIEKRLLEYTRKNGNSKDESRLSLPELPGDGELHRVYVLGNAARYPLVRELVAERLKLRILNHQHKPQEPCWKQDVDPLLNRIIFDVENLKDAVVKGGVVAQRVERLGYEVKFEWDHGLSRRLPFAISFDSLDRGQKTIYWEHEHYDDMKRAARPLPRPAVDPKPGQKIMLDRKWPGDPEDTEPKPFLEFEFPEALKGPLSVRYCEDKESVRFEIKDEGSDQTIVGKETPDEQDVPPMQRGDL